LFDEVAVGGEAVGVIEAAADPGGGVDDQRLRKSDHRDYAGEDETEERQDEQDPIADAGAVDEASVEEAAVRDRCVWCRGDANAEVEGFRRADDAAAAGADPEMDEGFLAGIELALSRHADEALPFRIAGADCGREGQVTCVHDPEVEGPGDALGLDRGHASVKARDAADREEPAGFGNEARVAYCLDPDAELVVAGRPAGAGLG